jgi:hypothetical protein
MSCIPVRAIAIALALWLSSVVQSAAQDQSGGIQGTVRDASSAVLPGVTVEATGPAMPGVATAISDDRGLYRFPALRPGVYVLTASLSGFTPVRIPEVVVRLGAEFRIDIKLELATLTESVTVTGEAPVVDVRQAAAISTISEQTLELLPARGRDFTDSISNLAGVQVNDQGLIGIDGASSLENNYIVDGLKTNAILTGENSQPVRMDFVEEIQVKSSGYAAEHGASMGGVINIVTKSGGDQFRGMAATYFEDPNFRWNGDYRPETRFSPIDNRTPETFIPLDDKNTSSPAYEWLGDFGGPIMRQRHWFYLSESVSHEPRERTVVFSRNRAAGPQTFNSRVTTFRHGFTLTSAMTNELRTRITGQFERDSRRRDLPSLEPDGVTSLENPATRFDLRNTENRPQALFTANVDYIANSKFFVSSKFGFGRTDRYSLEGTYSPELRHTFSRSNVGLAGVPADLQFPSGYTSTPLSNSARLREKFTRVAWDLNGTYYGSWKGEHAIKAGLNAEWITDDVFNGNIAPDLRLFWNTSFSTPDGGAQRGPFGYYEVRESGEKGDVTGNNVAFFVQDAWQPTTRLTINAGVRTERELVPTYIPGNLDLTFRFADKIAPRLGFAFDVTGDARWKAYGSYGLFYDIMKLRIARYHFGGEYQKIYYYSLDTADWPSVTCTAVGPPDVSGCPGTYLGFRDNRVPGNEPGENNRLDPAVKPSKTNEFVLGLDHELNQGTSVGMRYVRKQLLRLVEDVGILDFTPTTFRFLYLICNPGGGKCDDTLSKYRLPDGSAYPKQPPARRIYDALEFSLKRRLSANLFLNANYTWSYLRGTTTGLASEDIGQTTFPSLTNSYDTIFMAYDGRGNVVDGRLPNDRPHVFKVQGGYTMPWGTSLAVDYLAQSGEIESTHISQFSRETHINNRGDLGRVDTLSRIDLRLQHEFEFGGQSINLAMDVRNLFDQMAVTDIQHQPYRDGFFIPADVYLSPNGLDLEAYVAAFRAGAGDPQGLETLRSNAFYKQPIGWQPRRTFQFSARYRF